MNADTLANIPPSLKARRQWICWTYKTKENGKVTKPSVSPHTGIIASATDPTLWVSFDEAVAAAKWFNLPGVGFALSPDDNLTGGDLDDCWMDGKLSDMAKQVLNLAETYAEISPSGEGIRLIWEGKIPEAITHKDAGIEMYGTGRYLTITGQHIDNTPTEIMPAPQTEALLRAMVEKARASAEPAAEPAGNKSNGNGVHGDTFFKRVNSAALANIAAWVTDLFTTAKRQATGAWRVSSRNLGRDLEEDLSISPKGIKDWGVHDMGDSREGRRTPIDLVIEQGRTLNALSAARYLCTRLGVTPESLGWDDGSKILENLTKRHNEMKSQEEPNVKFAWEDIPLAYEQKRANEEGERKAADEEQQHAPQPEAPQKAKGKKRAKANNEIVTEDSAAVRFVEECGHVLRYCHSTGAWFRWDSNIWRKDETHVAFHWARLLARDLSEYEEPKTRATVGKTSFASGVEKFSQRDPEIAVTANSWDQDEWLLGTPAGTVDLRTGKLRPADPKDGITKSTLVAPAAADCPQWIKFLNEATGGNQELIRFLQQWLGYCLTGSISEHAFIFVYGAGGNGKGVFLNTTSKILGDYATTAAMDTFTATKSDRHPTDLAKLRGARIVTASETEHGHAWAEARIKAMTGGDRISARFMRQDFFEYDPQFKLTIIGNHKPVLRNVDDAMRRRINIIPFVLRPETPDHKLEEKLLAEAPGILQWMIEGCLDWQANGLIRPEIVQAATAEYFSDQDIFAQWVEEKCEVKQGNPPIWDRSADLFESWAEYSRKAGEEPGSQKSFASELRKRGFEPHRASGGGRAFKGIRLKPGAAADRNDDNPYGSYRPNRR